MLYPSELRGRPENSRLLLYRELGWQVYAVKIPALLPRSLRRSCGGLSHRIRTAPRCVFLVGIYHRGQKFPRLSADERLNMMSTARVHLAMVLIGAGEVACADHLAGQTKGSNRDGNRRFNVRKKSLVCSGRLA